MLRVKNIPFFKLIPILAFFIIIHSYPPKIVINFRGMSSPMGAGVHPRSKCQKSYGCWGTPQFKMSKQVPQEIILLPSKHKL